ncbi:MAG: diphthine--ammonia ligase [Deltaproteobacteria bacterium]
MARTEAIFCWSGGKDSSFALYEILKRGEYEVKYLLTTVNAPLRRISMHGVREELLDAQALSLGIELIKVRVTDGTNDEYERLMASAMLKVKSEGIRHVIFGDIFLADLRQYREKNLANIGMEAVFPLWMRDTRALLGDFLEAGFRTVTCCVSDEFLDASWAGREIDADFIANLPDGVDPCGERGEFHTFCYAGSIFKSEIRFRLGERVYKPLQINTDASACSSPSGVKGFWFCDLIPR